MRPEIINSLTKHINNETEVDSVIKIDGGFTGAEKYRISGEPTDVFLKVADLTAFPNEAVALDNEAASYGAIAQLPGVQKYFPRMLDYKRDESTAALVDGMSIQTGVTKFGALPGDGTKVGANAVTSPGTILAKNSVVKRLELVEQIPEV